MNLAQAKFNYMIVDIQEKQKSLESESQHLVDNISAKYSQVDFSQDSVSASVKKEITALLSNNVASVRNAFLQLFDDLMFKYADGWINSWSSSGGGFSSTNTGSSDS
jgi:hypothetical protein